MMKNFSLLNNKFLCILPEFLNLAFWKEVHSKQKKPPGKKLSGEYWGFFLFPGSVIICIKVEEFTLNDSPHKKHNFPSLEDPLETQ